MARQNLRLLLLALYVVLIMLALQFACTYRAQACGLGWGQIGAPMTYWSVVYTDAQAEPDVRRGIEQRDFGAFLPLYRTSAWCGDQPWEIRQRPLLPRYVFVNLREEDPSWVAINDTHGVNGVLMAAGAPARIPAEDIADLMLAHASGLYNAIVPVRDTVGRFRKHRKRRRRPRYGKVATGRPGCVLEQSHI
jgi:hypothetical protein